jgi:hypothetical protein
MHATLERERKRLGCPGTPTACAFGIDRHAITSDLKCSGQVPRKGNIPGLAQEIHDV